MEERVIRDYLDRLARELASDPALARRVCREAEDHLREAIAADPRGPGADAERRAVAGFGDARTIAGQFAVVELSRRSRWAGAVAVLAIAAVFAAMKLRLVWYDALQFPPAGMRSLAATVFEADRWAFWLAFWLGIAAWIYAGRGRPPAAFTKEYGARLRTVVRLGAVSGAALVACVAADATLTGLRLAGAGWSLAALVPLGSIALEAACAAALLARLGRLTRRIASAAPW